MKKDQPQMQTFDQVKKELMKNPKFRKAYETPDLAFEIACAVMRARIEKGMTQGHLAKKVKTKQSSIARLEAGGRIPSGEFLYRISKALGKKLVVRFECEPVKVSFDATNTSNSFMKI